MAKALRMGKDAFRAAKRRDPAVQDAIDRGRAVEHDKLVGVLHYLAMGGQYVPAIFLLKARHGYREGDAFEANVNLSLVIPTGNKGQLDFSNTAFLSFVADPGLSIMFSDPEFLTIPPTAPIPLPAPAALLIAGLVALLGVGRFRKTT